jgi:hypothetical integral membrane protein (TIGR02206 family)
MYDWDAQSDRNGTNAHSSWNGAGESMFDERYAGDFHLFGWVHILILTLTIGSLFGLYYARGALKRPAVGRTFRYSVVGLIVVLETVFQMWMAWRNGFHWEEFVPLGLCAMMEWITVVALLFDLAGVVKVVIPWAFVGSTLSFIVVNMGTSYTFPHFRFFHYFAIHWLFLVGNLFYLFTGRFTYTYRDLVRSTMWLAGVAAVVLGIDLVTDQNFMFLRQWPTEMDFVNHLLFFPLNAVLLMLGAFILFNIFYLAFVIRRFDGSARPSLTAIHDEDEGVVDRTHAASL